MRRFLWLAIVMPGPFLVKEPPGPSGVETSMPMADVLTIFIQSINIFDVLATNHTVFGNPNAGFT